ncbi:MAG: hypothetical protein RL708_558, partial [Bacteroidota bacterium]
MKRKFYIIAHNPNNVSDAIDCIERGANALEPDIRYDADDDEFYVYDIDPVFAPTLSHYLSKLSNKLNSKNLDLALIAFDLKVKDSQKTSTDFNFSKLLQIVNDNLINKYGNVPILFTTPHNIDFLKSIAPSLSNNQAIGTDAKADANEVNSDFKSIGVPYTYADGDSFFLTSSLKFKSKIQDAINLRDGGDSFSLVYTWTLSSIKHSKEFLDIGVDGIIVTDNTIEDLKDLINGDYSDRFELATKSYNPFTRHSPTITKPSPDFKVKTFKFIPNEMFVAYNNPANGIGTLIKIRNTGGTGHNMFALSPDGSIDYSTVSGYNYFYGSQIFSSFIVDVIHVGNETMIALSDGKILKVSGTGGSGHNMLAVNESASDFTSVTGYNYRIGDAKFNSGISCLKYINGYTFIGLRDGKLLKVNGTGGSGHNMFAVTESNSDFSTVAGYNYRVGDAKFNDYVKGMIYILGYTFIWFNNGKMLKINGTGGSGHNMFAVTESISDFSGIAGYNYYIGVASFLGSVQSVNFVGGYLFIGFVKGKML